MGRRTRPPQHPVLPFPSESDDPPVVLEEPPDTQTGGHHAVQDDHHRTASAAAPARLFVNLPADAKLTIDGEVTTSTSEERIFVSPELAPGKSYSYNRRKRKVLAVVNHYAGELKTRHEHWKAALPMSRPDMDSIQLASAAMEIAFAEVRHRLRSASLPGEKNPSSSGAARARSRNRTSRA